jgi:pyruvate/2-oxoglutarate dehydrogenase complex dihydrolipoamide acyltransferase (E2) component
MPVLRPAVMLLVAALLTTTACTGGAEEPAPAAAPSPSSTSLADFPTDALAVARASFCSRVAPAAVEDALEGAVESSRTWANGERASLAAGVRDIAHEFGCSWTGADGTTVRGWVFAPPVTRRQAGDLQRGAEHAKGCDPVPGASPYGARTAAVRCTSGGRVATSFHGLFGDAWLSCSLTARGGDRAALLDRTDRWCVTVAQAAAA